MKNIYNLIPFSLIAIVFLFQPAGIFAYSCGPIPPPCSVYWKYDYVFIGTVKNITTQKYGKSILFDIDKGFRGVESSTLLGTQDAEYDDINFEEGKKYVVYANKGKDSIYIPTMCTYSGLVENSQPHIEFFNSLNDGKPEFDIWGRVWLLKSRLKKPLEIEVSNGTQKLIGQSDDRGKFKLSVNEAGKYTVKVWIPKNLSLGEDTAGSFQKMSRVGRFKKQTFVEFEVEVKADNCAFVVVPFYLY